MPSKAEIEEKIARLKKLPPTPTRLREILALERCLGLEIRPARPKTERSRTLSGPKIVRKRKTKVEDDDEVDDTGPATGTGYSSFRAADYLGDILGSRHKGMS